MKKSKITNQLFIAIATLFIFLNTALAQEKKPPQSSTQENQQATIEDPEKLEAARMLNYAVIQSLNKTTAKTSVLEIRIGDKVKFGKLIIRPLKCWQAPLEQKPESKILLDVYEENSEEKDENKKIKRIFYGWMFASSPSISSIEHPVYDITAISCKSK